MSRARIAIAATDETGGAFQSVRSKLDTLGAEAAGVASRFAGLGAGVIGLLGTAAAFGSFIQGATESVTRLKDLQDATGSSIERLSGLTNLAGRAGLSFDTVSGALVRFNQALNSAKPNSAIAQAIERLGLNVRELREADPVDALQQVAQAFGRFADDGNKARLAQELFGRSISQVGPLLKELAENGELVASVTGRQAEEFDKLSKATTALSTEWGILLQRLAAPVVRELARDAALLRISGEVFGSTAQAIKTLSLEGKSFRNAADGVAFYTQKLAALNAQRRIADTEANPLARRNLVGRLDEEIAKVTKLDEVYRRLAKSTLPDLGQSDPRELARRGRGTGALPSVGATPDADPAGNARAAASAAEQYTQSLRDQLLATRNLAAEEQARIAINRGLLGVLDQGSQAQVLALARALDVRREEVRAQAESDAIKAEGVRLTASLRTETERLADEVARYDLLLANNAITIGTWARASSQGLEQSLRQLREFKLPDLGPIVPQLQRVSEFASQAARNIQDALGDSVLQVIKGNADSISDIWRDLLERMVAQALAAKLGEALFGNFGSTGQFGGLVGAIGAGLGFGGFRANGGPVSAGRAYVVGERGPEIIVPRSAGTVMPNEALGGVTINNYVSAGVTRNELVAALQLSQQNTEASIMRQLRAARVI
jgi:hypothetical protein